ncbi:MAG: histone deacetylase [Bacteroidetes bacterium]|nr:MAG: histone deacetylase [Bacteroidota bacterium]
MLKIAWSPLYAHPLPQGHRFPMEKYELIPEQLLYEGTILPENLYLPEKVTEDIVLRTHSAGYWHKLQEGLLTPYEIRRTGFPFSPRLVERGLTIAGGTLQNARFALEYGVAINAAGGTHHAFADRGEGFCIFNDIAIAASQLLAEGTFSRILVIDLDVHQGNGTASIFAEEERVFTLSVHCEDNYPLKKEKSSLDIGLPVGIEDEAYLQILRDTLPRLIEEVQPEMVFYLAGVDVLATDRLGKLRLSRAGCKARDEYVMRLCRLHRLPVTISLGGGYSYHIRDIVEAHCNTFRLAQELWF